jgi:hypothetical protein
MKPLARMSTRVLMLALLLWATRAGRRRRWKVGWYGVHARWRLRSRLRLEG